MPETTEVASDAPDSAPEGTVEPTDWQAEAEKWRALSKKQEARAKESHKAVQELQALKDAQLSDTEKAIRDARAEGAAEVRAEYASRLVATAFRGAAKGRLSNPDAVLSRVDRSQFLTEEGDVDESAIAEFLDSVAPQQEQAPASPPALFQGSQGDQGALALNGDPILAKVMGIVGR